MEGSKYLFLDKFEHKLRILGGTNQFDPQRTGQSFVQSS